VAGTIGGATYGVAKGVSLHAARVFGCSGGSPWSVVIAAVDWVTANAIRPAVANMSLGGGANDAADAAVRNSISHGITYVLSAGNDSYDACWQSPARVGRDQAITVGATNVADIRAEWSNHGPCLTLFAPGVDILSASFGFDTSSQFMSGTSMATPHVAGVAALYLQGNRMAPPADVKQAIVRNATKGVVIDPGPESPNLLLYSGGPSASVTPASLAFPAQYIGTKSTAKTVVLANTGTGHMNVTGVSVTGDFAIHSNYCTSGVKPGTHCNVWIVFNPRAAGTRTGRLSFSTNAPGSPHVVPLSGTGSNARASVSPTTISFANQQAGTSSSAKMIALENTGTGHMTVSSVSVTGDYVIESNFCLSGVKPGTHCNVRIVFRPTATGARTGRLTISTNAPGSPHLVALSGTGFK
jgi:hypothetical protein